MEENDKAKLVEHTKKNCSMCKTYKNFNPRQSDLSQQEVQKSLQELVGVFNSEYNALRKKDAEVEEILQAKKNKTTCWDAIGICQKCDKEIDKVRRELIDKPVL